MDFLMRKILTCSKKCRRHQQGFTLLELMLAIVIVMVVVVSVQRYMVGVMNDREHLSAQQDQFNQLNIILSNIQNDVARAGFVPVGSTQILNTPANKVGLEVRPCTGNNCRGNELFVSYWSLESPAFDCLHNEVVTERTQAWVKVENIYQFRQASNSKPLVLGCDGNGGGATWQGFTDPNNGDIQDFSFTLDGAPERNRLLHFCMNTRVAKSQQTVGASAPKACGTSDLPANNFVFHTVELDMLVRAQPTW